MLNLTDGHSNNVQTDYYSEFINHPNLTRLLRFYRADPRTENPVPDPINGHEILFGPGPLTIAVIDKSKFDSFIVVVKELLTEHKYLNIHLTYYTLPHTPLILCEFFDQNYHAPVAYNFHSDIFGKQQVYCHWFNASETDGQITVDPVVLNDLLIQAPLEQQQSLKERLAVQINHYLTNMHHEKLTNTRYSMHGMHDADLEPLITSTSLDSYPLDIILQDLSRKQPLLIENLSTKDKKYLHQFM